MEWIGEAQLGEFARWQIEQTRHDPRVDRARGAMVADFFSAIWEAERWREMTTWGYAELAEAVEREEVRLGVKRGDPGLSTEQRSALQAAWERAEMAKAEIANEYPHVHAATLISLQSALDALVEEFVPSMQRILALSLFEKLQEQWSDDVRSRWDDLSDEERGAPRYAR